MTKKSFAVVLLAIIIQLLVAVYLPINNIAEYWTEEPGWLSMHFYILTFAAFAFYILFGSWFWKSLSQSGRKMSITAGAGWAINLYLICINPYLNDVESAEPYIIGSMLIIAPCLILLLDFLIRKIKRKDT
ncbi:MAG: hypothetical protein JXM70_03760 [Pirellulales bacterium]|nr:hypothetical protein [Pirellulales bacterium]